MAMKLLHGTVDVLILKTLSQGTHHGFGVSAWIRRCTDGDLDLEDAALYQALHRLERGGHVSSEWGVSQNNRRAKYYQLTDSGRQMLHHEASTWRRFASAMAKVLEAV